MSGVWDDVVKGGGHAVIEASAGTGKTFTIGKIALGLIEEGVRLRNILIVTFTEKAAGELKNRLREAVSTALRERAAAGGDAGALKESLDDFDAATISTIHAFCKRVLSEFAFENGQPISANVAADDADMREGALRDALRAFAVGNGGFCEARPEAFSALVADVAGGGALSKTLKFFRDGDYDEIVGVDLSNAPAQMPEAGTDEDFRKWAFETVLRDAMRRRRAAKDAACLMTFDDMPVLLAKALAQGGPAAKRLVDSLRRKYQVALVDEFQDTDAVQWGIFRRVFFDDPPASGPKPRIIVVGDPKQAIYSFRGADINTYIRARREICAGGGTLHSLPETYRCTKELLEGLNAFFTHDAGCAFNFFDAPGTQDSIVYGEVGFPAKPLRRIASSVDGTGLAAITAIDAGIGNVALLRRTFARKAVEIIRAMVAHPACFQIAERDGPPRGVRLSDFCFLARAKNDWSEVEEELVAAGLPYAIYKEAGFHLSEEADDVRAVFAFLDDPSSVGKRNAALMTDFFGLSAVEVLRSGETVAAAAEAAIDKWRTLCRERKWERLFESMVEDGGAWFRLSQSPAGSRKLAGYRQIFSGLLASAEYRPKSIATFLKRLGSLKSLAADEADGSSDIRGKDTEAPRIQLMTMHAAKGLEFPFVFVCMQSTRGGRQGLPTVTCPDSRRRAILTLCGDGAEGDPFRRMAAADAEAEKKRLNYVALTRAQFKLFLPFDPPRIGKGGGELQRAGYLSGRISRMLERGAASLFDANKFLAAVSTAPRADAARAPGAEAGGLPAFVFAEAGGLHANRYRFHSFSSLTAGAEDVPPDGSDGAPQGGGDEGEGAQRPSDPDYGAEPKYPLVPRGVDSGHAFHRMMERLCMNGAAPDFASVGGAASPAAALASPDFARLVEESMAEFGVENAASEDGGRDARLEFAEMAWNALNVRLRLAAGGECALKDVPRGDRVAELDFDADERAVLPAGAPRRAGMLNGSIDLLFRFGGAYHVVDWKTNALDDYSPAGLAAPMEHYALQYKIYAVVAKKWLGKGAAVSDANYLFVRGVDAAAGRDAGGVHFAGFDEAAIEAFGREIAAAIEPAAAEGGPDGGK